MSKRNMNEDDPLEDFDHRRISLDGATKVVHVAGTGPAVIVMTEFPRPMRPGHDALTLVVTY